jgi:hypothetical protein
MSTISRQYKNQSTNCHMDCCVGKTCYDTPALAGTPTQTPVKVTQAKPRRVIGENEGWVTVTSKLRGPDSWKRKERAANKLLGIE